MYYKPIMICIKIKFKSLDIKPVPDLHLLPSPFFVPSIVLALFVTRWKQQIAAGYSAQLEERFFNVPPFFKKSSHIWCINNLY